ncbi:MAG: ABC transporter permease [Actinomycetota bacterium]|nr:ABC transporter permease [Actinomycetota bacterium]
MSDITASTGTGSATATEDEQPAGSVRAPFGVYLERYGIIGIWALIVIIFSLLRPQSFATLTNLKTILGTQAVLLVLTLGLLVPLTVGEFDLSVASMMSFAAIVVAELSGVHHLNLVISILVTLAIGIGVGLLNAFVVVRLGVSSFITTLGIGTLLGGLSYGISGSVTIGSIPSVLVTVASRDVFGLPLAFYYGVALCFLVWYIFQHTPLGRHLVFVGEGREIARLSGLPVRRIRTGSLIVSALVASFAGLLQAGVVGAADPGAGTSFLLPAFAAAFLGSTAIRPGRFNAWGTFVAVYFLVTGITGLELLGYTGWVQDVFYGGALVIAVALGRLVATSRARSR